jgi:hypothetical protein
MKMERKEFNQKPAEIVKRAIGSVIDPEKKDAIEPGSETKLRRRRPSVKKPSAKKRKRTPFL